MTSPTIVLSTSAVSGTSRLDRRWTARGNRPLRLTATLSRAVEADATRAAPNGPTTASTRTRSATAASPSPVSSPAIGPLAPGRERPAQPCSSALAGVAPTKPTCTSAKSPTQMSSETVRAIGTVRCGRDASPARSRA